MNTRSCLFVLLVGVLALSTMPARGAACDPVGGAEFICGLASPEDLVRLPETQWVLVSAMAEGKSHLYAVDAKTHAPVSLYPVDGAREQQDKKTYASCPGPLPKGTFGAHGIDIRPKGGGMHTLYAVNHAGRESIEVFNLDATGKTPTATWIGCAVFPGGASGNSVVGLPGGGFITSNFRDPKDADAFKKMTAGEITGNVLEWQPKSGWKPLPDSAMSGANGLALSSDGKWLYVAGWPGKNVTRFERTGDKWTKRDAIATGILTDNLRWAADGSLIAAGQDASMPGVFECRPPCYVGSAAVKIDPKTLKTQRLVSYAGNESFQGSTTVIDVGNEFWLGSFRGDRIARLPARAN
jgi:hypothetical protein